jgi:hypothetical protein
VHKLASARIRTLFKEICMLSLKSLSAGNQAKHLEGATLHGAEELGAGAT